MLPLGKFKQIHTILEENLHLFNIRTNTNVDLILSGTQLFKGLQIKTTESKNCQQIKSLSEFKECFLFFFRKGSAAERSFQSQQDFDHVIKATEKLEKKVRFCIYL